MYKIIINNNTVNMFSPQPHNLELQNRKGVLEKYGWKEGVHTHIFHKDKDTLELRYSSNGIWGFVVYLNELHSKYSSLSKELQRDVNSIVTDFTL
jgi:predicted transcriptional regulator